MFYRSYLMVVGVLVYVAVLGGCRVANNAAPPIAPGVQVTPVNRPTTPVSQPPTVPPLRATPETRSTVTPVQATPATRSAEAVPQTVIEVGDNFYDPVEIVIKPGTVVRWRHVGQSFHNVLSLDDSWGSSVLPIGGRWERTFGAEGVYDYYCSPHPQMTGRVIVKP